MSAPILTTERLTLRPPQLSDFDYWADYVASPRSLFEGGPFERQTGWALWTSPAGRKARIWRHPKEAA